MEIIVNDWIDSFPARRSNAPPSPRGMGWTASLSLAFPGGIPELKMAKNTFDDLFLFWSNRGDNLHFFTAGARDRRILVPGLGDRFCPGTSSFAKRLRLLISSGVEGFGSAGGRKRKRWCWGGIGGWESRRSRKSHRGRGVDGRNLDPPELSPPSGGEGAVQTKGDFVF